MNNWWGDKLNEYAQDGIDDADQGKYDPPHATGSYDPQDEDENYAYEQAWWKRRRELGDKFKWA